MICYCSTQKMRVPHHIRMPSFFFTNKGDDIIATTLIIIERFHRLAHDTSLPMFNICSAKDISAQPPAANSLCWYSIIVLHFFRLQIYIFFPNEFERFCIMRIKNVILQTKNNKIKKKILTKTNCR